MGNKPVKSRWSLGLFPVFFLIVLVGYIAIGFIQKEKSVEVNPDHSIFKIFDSKDAKKLATQVSKKPRVVLVGNVKDGINRFVEMVATQKSSEGYQFKRRQYQPDE